MCGKVGGEKIKANGLLSNKSQYRNWNWSSSDDQYLLREIISGFDHFI
jgi:hypothetical protein